MDPLRGTAEDEDVHRSAPLGFSLLGARRVLLGQAGADGERQPASGTIGSGAILVGNDGGERDGGTMARRSTTGAAGMRSMLLGFFYI